MAKKDDFKAREQAIWDEPDNTKRWRMAADLAREMNPEVKKEQDKQIKAMAEVRRLGLYRKTKTKKMGLKFAVSIPSMTFTVLSTVDPSLRNIDKSEWTTRDGSNQIARDLARVFPEYRAS